MGRLCGFDQVYSQALDWLFPARCAGCGALGEHWCARCQAQVQRLAEPLCLRCGTPLQAKGEDCAACSQREFAFTAARAWARYAGELRQAILKLKRRKNEALGRALAPGLIETLQERNWKIDAIIAIPLAPRRLAERGYNQVDLMAAPLAKAVHIGLLPGALLRRVETQPQKGLTIRERWENTRHVFEADVAQVRGRNVLVMDDIMTTGATLSAAAGALKDAGAKSVYALTLARTLLEDDPRVW